MPLAERQPGREMMNGMIYCVVPTHLAARAEMLRRHFGDDPLVEVVVERRAGERRGATERRARAEAPPGAERRKIRNAAGRRIGDNRAPTFEADLPPLPRRAKAFASELSFVERVVPTSDHLEDLSTGRLVTRIQAGDHAAFAQLYERYFDRVFSYLRLVLKNRHEAEDAAQQIFTHLFGALEGYEHRRSFWVWLFRVVQNHALNQLKRNARTQPEDPFRLAHMQEAHSRPAELRSLAWVSDQDLIVFMEKLPLAQRQVIVLRYMLDLSNTEIAGVLSRKPNEIAVLHYRAIGFLRERLTSIGREPKQAVKAPGFRGRTFQAGVLRSRRYALSP